MVAIVANCPLVGFDPALGRDRSNVNADLLDLYLHLISPISVDLTYHKVLNRRDCSLGTVDFDPNQMEI